MCGLDARVLVRALLISTLAPGMPTFSDACCIHVIGQATYMYMYMRTSTLFVDMMIRLLAKVKSI